MTQRWNAQTRHASLLPVLAIMAALVWTAPARAATVTVAVDGVTGELRDNVRAVLGIQRLVDRPDTRRRTIRRMHRRAEADIREALQPFGYYRPQVQAELDETDDGYAARYVIDQGPQTTIAKLDIRIEGDGADEAALTRAKREMGLAEGDALRHSAYRQAKAKLRDAAYGRGYLDADYKTSTLRVNPQENRAEITLVLTTGPAYTFGPVTIEQDILDADFLARYVTITPGQRFDPGKLINLQIRLTDLGYFANVQVDARREDIEGTAIPVVVNTLPLKPERYEVGIGFGTDTGARLSIGTELRRINRRGHSFNADLQLSEVLNTLNAQYLIPVGSKPGESLTFNTSVEDEILEDGERTTLRVGVARNWQLGEWFRRYYLTYLREDFRFDGDSRQQTDLLTPGVSFSRTEIDDPVYGRRGWSAFFDVHGAEKTVISDTSFVQTTVSLRGVMGLWSKARLLTRLDLGSTWVEEFSVLPASERFFAGGDESVRGYAFESLGPRDAQNQIIGGEHLVTSSLEVEQLITNTLGFAVFADAGNASDNGIPEPVLGAGAGLRVRSPVGVLRLDLAHPFDGEERGVRLHLGIRAGL
ncbi:outer membrane protein assembly factor [bacterium]|nr:outer membrane protein assembly factor [bacterium]